MEKTSEQALHRVSVVYKPEKDETFSTEEQFGFSTYKNAREFLYWIKKNPSVTSARYISSEAHKN